VRGSLKCERDEQHGDATDETDENGVCHRRFARAPSSNDTDKNEQHKLIGLGWSHILGYPFARAKTSHQNSDERQNNNQNKK